MVTIVLIPRAVGSTTQQAGKVGDGVPAADHEGVTITKGSDHLLASKWSDPFVIAA